MNLHAIASRAIAAVNPPAPATIQMSVGYATSPDGTRVPAYADAVDVSAQVQSLSYNDIQHLDGLNIQGVRSAIYLYGDWSGLVRPDGKGGDLIRVGGQTWLVAVVLENWPGWTKVAVTLQNEPRTWP